MGGKMEETADIISDAADKEEQEREWDLLDDIEEPEPDYTNSGPLDLHLYSEHPNVEEVAKFLCSEIGYP